MEHQQKRKMCVVEREAILCRLKSTGDSGNVSSEHKETIQLMSLNCVVLQSLHK